MVDLSGYKLTFDDEFNARSISKSGVGTKWSDIRQEFRYDDNSDIGFGNSSFVDASSGYDPFGLSNGALSITAVTDRTAAGYPGSWESGLIHTKNSFSQTYGYFEMRADLSNSPGAWDAFWLLPMKQSNNPNGWQELDVVEHYGGYDEGVFSWIHTTDYHANPSADLQVFSVHPEQTTGYHTYGMEWTAERISFFVDGVLMGWKPTPSDMHGPMYMVANLATQSGKGEDGSPMTMKIDYIRAYSSDPNATAVPLDTVSAPDAPGRILTGSVGNDVFVVKSASDRIIESAGQGIDTVRAGISYILPDNVEDFDALYNGKVWGTGNSLDNEMTGNGNDNVLRGMGGSDTLIGNGGNDTLDGGSGADTMTGGTGDDIYYVDNLGDTIVEAAGQGTDTVRTGISYTLADNVENLEVLYNGRVWATGNGLDNTITGNAADNVLLGMGGNDILNGGGGNDTLTGGAGADTFVFSDPLNGASNVDRITDFTVGQDVLRLDSHVFTGLSAGQLAAQNFVAGALASSSSPSVLYNGATGVLSYDADGSGSGASVQFATLGTGLHLTASSFIVS